MPGRPTRSAEESGGGNARPLSIGEVARRAGVARSTISYALSGKRSISPEKRKEILRIVKDLGYQPNASARALAEGKSRTVALVVPPPSHRMLDSQLPFVVELSELASAADLDLLLLSSGGDRDRPFQRMLSGKRVDGVLVMEVRMQDQRIAALRRSGLPYVLIGRPADPAELLCADIDYGGMVERCVDHLADLGHRRVALLNRPQALFAAGYGPARRAAEGFAAAAARRGLRTHAFCCPDDAAGGEACVRELLAARPRITAAVTISDGSLAGVGSALQSAGIQLPRDFSLVGVVGDRCLRDFDPPLTAAVLSPGDLARSAFELLLRRMADPRFEPRHVLQSPSITVRASTGPVPGPAERRPGRPRAPLRR